MNRSSIDSAPGVTTIADLVTALRARIPHTRSGIGRELIIEMRDGLEDSAAAYRSAGLPAVVAEQWPSRTSGSVWRTANASHPGRIGAATGRNS